MDTIHTLNTSLPSSTSRSQDQPHSNHQRQQPNSGNNNNNTHSASSSAPKYPPPSLHAAFKSAAFAVAQLYKTAATDSDSSRAAGYQDAIDDLLAFLDQENLGLGDGEGWRVRQWATERLEPSVYGLANSDAGDDYVKEDQTLKTTEPSRETRSEDAGVVKQQSETQDQTLRETADDNNPTTTANTAPPNPTSTASTTDKSGIFRFTSNPAHYDTDMTNDDTPFNFNSPVVSAKSPTSLRLNLRPHRLGNPNATRGRNAHAASMSLGTLGLGAGTKRKSPPVFADFFDFGLFGSGNGGGGGGGGTGSGGGGAKRGRTE